MADDDKAKAEKLAAAKKRYEQMKKQKTKKTASAKSGPKEESAEEPGEQDKSAAQDGEIAETGGDEDKDKKDQQHESKHIPTTIQLGTKTGVGAAPKSPTSEAADIYRKQAQRIDELQRENKSLQGELLRLQKVEEEIQEVRESNADRADLQTKAAEADELKGLVEALQRQNSQLTVQLGSVHKTRTDSSADAEVEAIKAESASKSATIEALELQLSSANADLVPLQSAKVEQQARIVELQGQLEAAQSEATSALEQLQRLESPVAIANPDLDPSVTIPPTSATIEDTSNLQAQLTTAKQSLAEQTGQAEKLAAKLSTLTTLQRDAEARSSTLKQDHARLERELKEVRLRVAQLSTENDRLRDEAARHARIHAQGDAAELDELEDEERARLTRQVRQLESQLFDAQRQHWQGARKSLQPDLPFDDQDPATDANGFSEVDLSVSKPWSPSAKSPQYRQVSSFADVIQSGIAAFTGTDNRRRASTAARRYSSRKATTNVDSATVDGNGAAESDGDAAAGTDEDAFADFDQDAFRLAQQEEALARLERVKQLKRDLVRWTGWSVDLVDLRTASANSAAAAGAAGGVVFEV